VVTRRKETANLSIAKTAQNREINPLPRRSRARTSAAVVSALVEVEKADAEVEKADAEVEKVDAVDSSKTADSEANPESKLSQVRQY